MRGTIRPAAPLAGAVLAACVAGEPSGPPLVLLTVSGVGSPAFADAMDTARVAFLEADGGRSTWELLAALATGLEPPAPADGAPARLAGDATTLWEVLTREGLETAIVFDGATLTEESGLLQGGFQILDGPTLDLATGGPTAVFAAEEGLAFVGDKLPRPMEDAPALWLHLDLAAAAPEEARSQVADLWGRFGELLEADPRALLVGVALPTPDLPGAVLFDGAGAVPSRAGLPIPLLDLPPTILGLLELPGRLGGGTDHSERLRR